MSILSAVTCCLMATCATIPVSPDDSDTRTTQSDSDVRSAINDHCIVCHGQDDVVEGEVNLGYLDAQTPGDNVELIRRVIRVLDLQEMPPEDERQPDPSIRKKMIRDFRSQLEAALAKGAPETNAPIRRMNRFQYNNAVIDLFELRCIVFTLPERMMRVHRNYFQPDSGRMGDTVTVGNRPLGKSQMIEPRLAGVAAFPQDLRAEHGYDNQADHLSMSPLLMESFLKLGQSIMQSKDFHARNVGVWKELFAAPPESADMKSAARKRLAPFLTKAFRRTVTERQLDRYSSFANRQLDAGVTFTQTMKNVAAAAISSPRFLYLYSTPSTSGVGGQQRAAYELATRMSFFLWGSIPDDTLLRLAESGDLNRPDVVASQFERMLADGKLKRFCDSFPAQWLQLDRLISSVPDRKLYPQFYFSKYRDSMHMMMEPLLLFETVLIENLPITHLIDPDFTYRSVHLDNCYADLTFDLKTKKTRGGGAVAALTFYRVPVSDRRTGGVITNAAVMTMTSGPERTQPITRGAWIASVIFNNPPDPPPADVPPLDEKPSEEEEHLTLRERLAAHRERSDCRGCHEQIDPLGFALENYNPIGVWRTEYENGRSIDMAGTLLRRHAFSDIVEFKDAILEEKQRFAEALAGHLLSFALARRLSASDDLAIRKIAAAAAADDYRIHTLLREVVLSRPFLSASRVGKPENEGQQID